MITKQSLEHVDKTHQQQQLVSPSAASSATDDFMWKIRSPSHYRKPARTIYLYRDPDFVRVRSLSRSLLLAWLFH